MQFPSYEYYLIDQVYKHSLREFIWWFCVYLVALLIWVAWSLIILPSIITFFGIWYYITLILGPLGAQLVILALICLVPILLSFIISGIFSLILKSSPYDHYKKDKKMAYLSYSLIFAFSLIILLFTIYSIGFENFSDINIIVIDDIFGFLWSFKNV